MLRCKNCGVPYGEIPFECRDHAPPKGSIAELRAGLEAMQGEKLMREMEEQGIYDFYVDVGEEWRG